MHFDKFGNFFFVDVDKNFINKIESVEINKHTDTSIMNSIIHDDANFKVIYSGDTAIEANQPISIHIESEYLYWTT